MRIGQKIRRTFVYRLTRFFFFVFNFIPRNLAIFLGGWIGLTYWKIITKDQHLMFRHLGLCYGDTLSVHENAKIGQRFFINSGRNIADLFRLEKHYDREIAPIIEVEGLEHFDYAYKKGKGVWGVTGHLGNFELLAVYLSKLGYRIGAISRPLADNKLNELLVKYREKLGIVNFNASSSPIGVVKWLKSGGAVGVLIDTDSARVKGEFIPVFHRLAKVPVGQTVIAVKLGVALVPMACLRTAEHHYRVIIRPEIPINISNATSSDVYNITKSTSLELEKLIRQFPDQWIWMHNRWRSSPSEKRA